MLSQLPWSYLRVFPILLGANLCCESASRPAQFFNLIRVESTILCKSRDPLSTQSVFPIHNSIGRAFSCTVILELSNPPFSYAVLAKFSLQLENHRAVRFASKRLFIRQENLFLCVQSLAVEADATASHRDPACQLK